MIFENKDVLETTIFFEVENAVAVSPKNVFNLFRWQGGQAGVVVGRFNNYFMCADTVHAVEHAVGLAVERTFDAEGGELIGDHADRPAGGVFLGRRTAVRWAIGLDFRWRLVLIARAEGAKAAPHLHVFAGEVSRALGTVGGNDDPPAHNWIFS